MMNKYDKTPDYIEEELREVEGEETEEEDSDEERTVNTQDFGNQNESDIKPVEAEEMINEEEERRNGNEEE